MKRLLLAVALSGCALPEPGAPAATELSMVSVVRDQGCALGDDGLAYCWGQGTDLDFAALPRPFALGPVRFTQVVSTGTGICGVLEAGGVACMVDRDAPLTPVSGEPEFTRLVAGPFVCGETASGEIWCWSKTGGPATKIAEAGELHALSIGNVACALNASDLPECWTEPAPTAGAFPVLDTIPFRKIIPMNGWMCGQALNDDVFCWSISPSGTTGTVYKVPTNTIFDGTHFVDIYGGSGYLGLISDGGRGYYFTAPNATFTWPEGGGHHWQYLAVGRVHVCGVLVDGRPACFGQNFNGQLGNGTLTHGVNATLVGGGTP